MMTSLDVENYRRFERYRLDSLRRVNLLVGHNGCGKTSLLEAVYLLASASKTEALKEIAYERREEGNDGQPLLTHFFHGHGLRNKGYFRLSSQPVGVLGELTVRVTGDYDVRQPASRSVRMVTPRSVLPRRSDAFMCTAASVQSLEDDVVDAMRVVDHRVTKIQDTGQIVWGANGVPSGILVTLEKDGASQQVPPLTLGEGFLYWLRLYLCLCTTRNGLVLADEIDTGLHYSVMGDMWRLVVEAAKRSDVQVFATTHSLDCVRGLAWFCQQHPELQNEVSLQKIHPSLEEGVAFNAESIMIAAEQEIEVR
jgi:hypothetical protein